MYENELYHFGVKGMKWGVRRERREAKNAYKRAKQAEKIAYRKYTNSMRAIGNRISSSDEVNLKNEGFLKMQKARNEYYTARKKTKEAKEALRSKRSRQLRENARKAELELAKKNENRILSEINEYDKKVGGDYAKKFLETYDDLEMWDLYSPEQLKAW